MGASFLGADGNVLSTTAVIQPLPALAAGGRGGAGGAGRPG
jgi:hypothetical protein